MISRKDEKLVCRLSHPAHPHILSRRAGTEPPTGCFADSSPRDNEHSRDFHYYCTTCDVEFHDQCQIFPRKMTHPYHPQHPLIFSVLNDETGIISDVGYHDEYNKGFNIDSSSFDRGNIFDNCTWCGVILRAGHYFYRCSICNFCLDYRCSESFPCPTIANPYSHHHSLSFLPRPLLLPCDACGLVDRSDPSYACFQCNYVVHKSCIYLPRVIKLTRHPHRLFYTPFLSTTSTSPCRLCYKTVDMKYGQYSCNDDCSYVVHSKCATHMEVWDRRELEWEPEEIDTEDVTPFKKVGDDLIKYFCHEHHLKLKEYDDVRDVDKQCQACILHIDSRDFYNCMECDYFLHEVCANLPRKLDHALHNHPLFLDPVPSEDLDSLHCSVCTRAFTGFRYKCSNDDCKDRTGTNFQVDVGCILLPDLFTHKSHKHPLFIPIHTSLRDSLIFCKICKGLSGDDHLQCTLCEFAICYKCATIPDKLHYKYDARPLSLCYDGGEISGGTYWCEVCEEEIDPSEWFYTCNKPCVTIHHSCLIGKSAYMKPGYTFYDSPISGKVLCNSSNTRPICDECAERCSTSVYFKLSNEMVLCSFDCLESVL